MPHRYSMLVLIVAVLFSATRAGHVSGADKIDFDRQIRPILADKCFHCHGPDVKGQDSELRLDTKEEAFKDLGGHYAIVPGDVAASEVAKRISSDNDDEKMPPPDSGRSLTPAQIELLQRWIAEGASWQQHWSFVPVTRPALPVVKDAVWARGAVDTFILAKLDSEGLTPSSEAPKETLLRRVTLDLTGLPPTLPELDAFLVDPSPDAYEKVVDRLLASPRYGEHMVGDWLDTARYADTNGYQGDRTRSMWPWRDWAISAFNRNQPFDEFTKEQLAGDLLPDAKLEQKIATGFHRNHMLNGEGGRIAEESRVDYVIDRVDTTAATWLGMTLGCARCHDHKYDPFAQKDYYRLYAYFNNVPESGAVDRDGSANPVIEVPSPEQSQRLRAIEEQLKEQQTQLAALTAEQQPAREELEKKIKEKTTQRDNLKKQFPIVMVMEEQPKPRDAFILLRGVWDKPGEKVTAGVPQQFSPALADAPANRLGLAQWLVDPKHPLTSRVTVNRYWQRFFGTGLVKTAEDFGAQGERPSHPELLDWLASEFVVSGWDVKAMHRLIVTSATYRQSSRVTAPLVERDPENRLLARGPRYRWPSAVIRDQALAVSGLLVEQQGGPAVKPYQPAGVWEEMSFGGIRYDQDHGDKLYRRSLYTFWRRTTAPTELFDTASRQVCTVKQSRTNTPLHALTLLNDVTYLEAARALAERALKSPGASPSERIAVMFRLATSRPPQTAELEILTRRFDGLRNKYEQEKDAAAKVVNVGESKVDAGLDTADLAAYAAIATIILNLDETLNKE